MKPPTLFSEDWKSFLEMSYDGIVIANHEGRIVYMNPAAERLEEVKKEEILGRMAKELEEEGIYRVSIGEERNLHGYQRRTTAAADGNSCF